MGEMRLVFCFGDVARNVFCVDGPREAQAKRGTLFQFGTALMPAGLHGGYAFRYCLPGITPALLKTA